MTASLLAALTLLCGSALAGPGKAEPVIPAGASPALKDVLGHFVDISRIYRKSGEEKGIRDYLASIAQRRGFAYETDAGGNLIVSVPGTGRFAGSDATIALQGHMDMVLDAKGAVPGEDVRPRFAQGVQLVSENGMIHSRDFATTIGADDGIGVALMSRYMTDSKLVHPPLKLVFTTEEETTMKGASHLRLAPDVKALINLDSEDFGRVTQGSLGAGGADALYTGIRATPVPNGWVGMKVSLDGLKGGHSGGNIHLGGGNAAKLAGEFVGELARAAPHARVVSLAAGESDPAVFNKIPKSFEIELAVPREELQAVKKGATAFESEARRRFGEVDTGVTVHAIEKSLPPGATAVQPEDLGRLSKLVSEIPNGVLTRNADFKDGMDLSSNLSFFSLKSAGASYEARIGIMPRAFTDASLAKFVNEMKRKLESLPLRAIVQADDSLPAWTPDSGSWLVKLLKEKYARMGGKATVFESASGGLETSHFAKKYPSIPMVSLGPDVMNAHSYEESLRTESVQELMDVLDRLLPDIGDAAGKAHAAATRGALLQCLSVALK